MAKAHSSLLKATVHDSDSLAVCPSARSASFASLVVSDKQSVTLTASLWELPFA